MSSQSPSAAAIKMLTPLLNNLYWVHRDIVAAIAHAIPQRPDEEVVWLAAQLAREAAEIPQYRALLDQIGFEPTESIRIKDSRERYSELRRTNNAIVLAVGMNVVAQGTLGIIEHECLHRKFPEFLSFFPAVIGNMEHDLDRAVQFLAAQAGEEIACEMDRLWKHLHRQTFPEIAPLIGPLIDAGIFPETIADESADRFIKIGARLGIKVDEFAVY